MTDFGAGAVDAGRVRASHWAALHPSWPAASGLRLPVYPLKGYSITLAVDGAPGAAPRVSVTDSAHKVVFARLGSRLRVAGMAELVGPGCLDSGGAHRDRWVASTRALFPNCRATSRN